MKYIVRFEFKNDYGEWKKDYFSNNGQGWTIRDAEDIAVQLEYEGRKDGDIRNVTINEL